MKLSALDSKRRFQIMLLVLTALLAHKTLAQGNACRTGGGGSSSVRDSRSEENCSDSDDSGGAESHSSQESTGSGGQELQITDDWTCRGARFDLLSFGLMLANAETDECAASCKRQAENLRNSLANSAFITANERNPPICNFGYACVRWTSNEAKMAFPNEASSSSSEPVSKPQPPENLEQVITSASSWFNDLFEQYNVNPNFWNYVVDLTKPGQDSPYNPGFYGRAVSDYFNRVSNGASQPGVPISHQKLSRPDTVCKCHFDVDLERVAWQNVPTCMAPVGTRDENGRPKSPQHWPGLGHIFHGFFFERDRYGLEDAPFIGQPESCDTPSRTKECCRKQGLTSRTKPEYVTDEELLSVPTECVQMTPFKAPPQHGSYASPYFDYGGSGTLPYAEWSADNQEL